MSDLARIDISDARDGYLVARVTGDLDLANLHAVHTALLDATPNDALGLVVDLAGVEFLDSSGVETLFRLQRSLAIRQQRFAVAMPPEATARRALELSGALGEMALCPGFEAALEMLRATTEGDAQQAV
jgi:anti-anti-sigma factor